MYKHWLFKGMNLYIIYIEYKYENYIDSISIKMKYFLPSNDTVPRSYSTRVSLRYETPTKLYEQIKPYIQDIKATGKTK